MKTIKRNWMTTLAGILALALSGVNICADPDKAAADPSAIGAAVVAGIGLILARDAAAKKE